MCDGLKHTYFTELLYKVLFLKVNTFFLCFSTDEYNENEEQYDEKPATKAKVSDVSDDKPQEIVEDFNTETSALATQDDPNDPDYIAHRGCK